MWLADGLKGGSRIPHLGILLISSIGVPSHFLSGERWGGMYLGIFLSVLWCFISHCSFLRSKHIYSITNHSLFKFTYTQVKTLTQKLLFKMCQTCSFSLVFRKNKTTKNLIRLTVKPQSLFSLVCGRNFQTHVNHLLKKRPCKTGTLPNGSWFRVSATP